jgi:uncharacterized protein (TIGR02145 family)
MQKIILLVMLFMMVTIIYSQNPCPGVPTVTYAGKTYNTVQIGTQCWLKENLDVGTMIQGSQEQTNNSIIEKYCYNNDPNNCATYGGLYQWNEAMAYSTTSGTKGLCPDGWHIPTKAEFEALAATVNNDSNALKAIGQGTGNGSGTNTSGFSVLLTGFYNQLKTAYYLGIGTYFWTSIVSTGVVTGASTYYLNNSTNMATFYINPVLFGESVRCLKDASTTSVEQEEGLPTTFQLMQNYPNPFNPSTAISYQLPAAGYVRLKIYDLLGSEISTLVNEYQQAGIHNSTFNTQNLFLPSGIYFYRLQAGNYTDSKKMLLIK